MVWGLTDSTGNSLPPRVFSNGKDQEKVIDEIIEAFEDYDLVFLKGGVGSGKSIIGATVAGQLGKGHINVPVKPLQDQYKQDYEGRLFIKLNDNNLKIHVLKGRNNFTCKKILGWDVSCASNSLRCTMVLPKGTPRWKMALNCKYWSPIYSNQNKKLDEDENCTRYEYETHGGTQYYYRRKPGCGYYDQNDYYINSDVLIFNNAKWQADTMSERKPLVNVEIFDEADYFLDSLSMQTRISSRRLIILGEESKELQMDLEKDGSYDHISDLQVRETDVKNTFSKAIRETEPDKPLDFNSDMEELLLEVREWTKLLDTENSSSLRMEVDKILNYKNNASFYVKKRTITFFVPDPSIVLHDFLRRSAKKMLFMSATLQNDDVLNDIYGLSDFAHVEGETKYPGKLYVKTTGQEMPIKYSKWQNDEFKMYYWDLLEKINSLAAKPILVQVHSPKYLPEEKKYPHILTRDQFSDIDQDLDIKAFKKKEKDIIYSTKTDRGIDLPDDFCRSIVILKYPFPDLSDPQITQMKKRLKDEAFWNFYRDIGRRDLFQQVGRGLRNEEDWIEVWSPDLNVINDIIPLSNAT